MNTLSKIFLIWIGMLLIVSSCSYKKKNILFKSKKKLKTEEPVLVVNMDSLKAQSNYKHIIKIGDRVQLRFLNNYDLGQGATQSATAGSAMDASANLGYLVNYDSTATLPLIGRVNLVGKDRLQAAKYLEAQYSKFISNPIIDVNIPNLKVTVLGEVMAPGQIVLDKENTTLVDVIAMAGGFKDAGRKDRIKIIRGNEIIMVNMKMIESLKSSDIIIHHNDIVYVEPYSAKAATEPIVGASAATTLLLTLTQLILISLQIYTITSSK
jgi:polysaccharide export outer membrane protein